jgi:hypothetical protein
MLRGRSGWQQRGPDDQPHSFTRMRYDAGMLKYLRLAVTALCLTACVLLIVLWVRSYGRSIDFDLAVSSRAGVGLRIKDGTIAAQFGDSRHSRLKKMAINEFLNQLEDWEFPPNSSIRIQYDFSVMNSPPPPPPPPQPSRKQKVSDFRWRAGYVRAPFWFITLAVATVACVPWIGWSKRFSLRTLLIATTLVAVGLGMVIYVSK